MSTVPSICAAFSAPAELIGFRGWAAKPPAEDLLRYWNSMVTVTTEPASGLVNVAVRAFTPQDAVDIAAAIRRNSEALVNRLQERPRTDLVDKSQAEVRAARTQAAEAREAVTRYRNAQASVDPLDTARSVAGNVAELNRELVALDVELTTAKATMGPNAPNIANLQARRDSVKEQIRGLERRIASVDASDRTAAALLVDYDRLEIERTLAEKQVSVAERILDQVRAESSAPSGLHRRDRRTHTWPRVHCFPSAEPSWRRS